MYKKDIKNFLLKFFHFYQFKNLCILHGHVFVMCFCFVLFFSHKDELLFDFSYFSSIKRTKFRNTLFFLQFKFVHNVGPCIFSNVMPQFMF